MAEIQPPVDAPINGGAPAIIPPEPITGLTKRQRRPSVRLGEIGDQITYDNHKRTNQPQQWKHSSKSSKTRNLETLDHDTSWKLTDSSKSKRGFSIATKKIRSNWISKTDNDNDHDHDNEEPYDYDDADRYTDQSLNLTDHEIRVRVSDGTDNERNWNDSNLYRSEVRVWLNQLGLSRYFSIFEVHEVDDDVLPLLTLEDLKDMGINAVGSRRKMFSSIQKLGKGFS